MALMKRLIAWCFALLSGFYLIALGWIPDPIPFLDEATALLILVKSTSYLGYDLTRFIPFLGKGRKSPDGRKADGRQAKDQTVDV